MARKNIVFVILVLTILTVVKCVAISAETWRLGKEEQWQKLSDEDKDKARLAIAEIKKKVNMGQTQEVGEAVAKLKSDFSGIAGPDFDAFIKAEKLLSEKKYVKAGKSYEKFLQNYPKSALYDAALERQMAVATALMSGEKRRILKVFKIRGHGEGVRVMEKAADRAGDSPTAIRASVSIAKSYENRRKYEAAYLKWSEISSRWSAGEVGKDSLLGMGRCKHAAYKGPAYDNSNLKSARTYYENFKQKHPEEASDYKIGERIDQIEEQLAYKRFETGEYYQRTGNEEAALFYYRLVAEKHSNTSSAKRAAAKISGIESTAKKG